MKLNIILLLFALTISIAIIGVKNSSVSKRSNNNNYEIPNNHCPLPKTFERKNLLKEKNLKQPEEGLSDNMKKLKKAGKLVYTINKLTRRPAGIPSKLIERDLQDAIKVYLKNNQSVKNEFQKMLNKQEGFPQAHDWVHEAPKCFGNIAEQDQGSCGSCYIFSAVNYFSILRCLNLDFEVLTPLSTQDVLSCMEHKGDSNNCEGGSPKDVWDYLYTKGVVSHSCKCYRDYDYNDKKPAGNLSFLGNLAQKYSQLEAKSIQECQNKCNDSSVIPTHFKPQVQEVLMTSSSAKTISSLVFNYGVLIGTLFYKKSNAKYYEESDKDPELLKLNSGKKLSSLLYSLYPKKDEEESGHAVIIVGYKFKLDDRCRKELMSEDSLVQNCVYFKILNSWGKDFGDNGYAYIPDTFVSYSYLAFANKDQVKRFINDTTMKKDIYSFTNKGKSGLKLEDILKHHMS